MVSYALRLAALALLGGALIAGSGGAAAQTATPCTLSGPVVSLQTYVAGTAIAATGVNPGITFPTATVTTGCTAPIVYTLRPIATAGSTGMNVPGLTFNGSATPRPTLTGMPTAPTGFSDTHAVAYTATGANGSTATAYWYITIEADSTPSFAETSYEKTFYVDRYELWRTPLVTGGNHRSNRRQYSILDPVSGMTATLPTGLKFWPNGEQLSAMSPSANSGTPQMSTFAAVAEADYTLKFTDADGDFDTTTLKLTVAERTSPDFFEDSVRVHWILNGKARNSIASLNQVVLQGAGGPGTTYALSGTLPAGLSWTAATRVIAGPPTEAGTFPLTLTATDSNGVTDTQSVTIIVSPTTAPWFRGLTRRATDCTTVRIGWAAPQGGNPAETGWMSPTITGYRIEGKQRGVDGGWGLVAEVSGSTTSYTHSGLPPGSQWSYRIRALTAGGVNPWTLEILASTNYNDSRPWRALEVGMVLPRYFRGPNGGQISRYQWYRSPDQATPDWTPIAGATEGFYEVTDADVGQLFAIEYPTEEFYISWSSIRLLVGAPTPLTGSYDPVIPDDSPSFAATGERIAEPPETVNIQLPSATGGSGTVVYTLSPDLPDGLAFDADDLTITGAPPADWTGDYTLTARDADCDVGAYALAIGPEPVVEDPEPEPKRFVPLEPYGLVTITVAEEGDAPEDAEYGIRLGCGFSTFTPALAAGESYDAWVVAGSLCALTMTDRQGAWDVRGEFRDRLIRQERSAVTLTARFPTAGQPDEQLEGRLVAGLTVVRWRGAARPIADAVADLTLRVTAVYRWEAATQTWLSWFPDAEDLGVNTLDTFEPGGIYFIFAEEREDAAAP